MVLFSIYVLGRIKKKNNKIKEKNKKIICWKCVDVWFCLVEIGFKEKVGGGKFYVCGWCWGGEYDSI